jgi:hypothetical protein
LGYSLVEYQAWTLFSKAALADRAKRMKARSILIESTWTV